MMRWITQRNSLIVTLPRPLLSFCPLSLTPLLVSSRPFQDAGSIAHLMPCGSAAPWTAVDPPLVSAVHESVGLKVFSHGAQCLEGLVSKNLALSGHPRLTRRLCKIPSAVGFSFGTQRRLPVLPRLSIARPVPSAPWARPAEPG